MDLKFIQHIGNLKHLSDTIGMNAGSILKDQVLVIVLIDVDNAALLRPQQPVSVLIIGIGWQGLPDSELNIIGMTTAGQSNNAEKHQWQKHYWSVTAGAMTHHLDGHTSKYQVSTIKSNFLSM